jgi:hypothetical protein
MDINEQETRRNNGRVLVGLLIIAAGLIMLADRTGWSAIHLSGRFWPLFPIGFGVLRLLDPPASRKGRTRSRRGGAWFIFIGLWFFVNEFHLFGLDYHTSWPLLIVGAGAGMVWRALEHPAAGSDGVPQN